MRFSSKALLVEGRRLKGFGVFPEVLLVKNPAVPHGAQRSYFQAAVRSVPDYAPADAHYDAISNGSHPAHNFKRGVVERVVQMLELLKDRVPADERSGFRATPEESERQRPGGRARLVPNPSR